MRPKTSRSFYWAMSFIVLTPLVISLILMWAGHTRMHEFETHQQHIAHSSIEILAEDIGNIIEENHRLVKLFADDELALIVQLANNPDDYRLRAVLLKKIKRFFPHAFAFTITDTQGNPLLDDFDGYVGEICISDMQQMLASRKSNVRIHPNPYVYHYDTMAAWEDKTQKGIFFISFAPEMISRLLRAASPVGHELMLLIKDPDYLMEITEQGARNMISRDDYRLTASERAQILDLVPVRDSQWHLADLASPDLFADFRQQIYLTYGLVICAFILTALTFSWVLIYFERKRQQAEAVRDEMLSLFSHDLRTPLIGIKGAMDLLKQHSATIEQTKKAHLYRLIHDYVLHMSRIVDDILDIHKLETGSMSFNFAALPLTQLASETVAMLTDYARQFGVNLELIDKTDGMLLLWGDKQRLIQAISNLINNAVKFSPAGETVTVRTYIDHNMVKIAVEDHGPGIPAAIQPFVFQKFVHSRQHQVHNVPSTGLGLTIVKYITEAHGGHVRFETLANKGTTFVLALPLHHPAKNSGDTA